MSVSAVYRVAGLDGYDILADWDSESASRTRRLLVGGLLVLIGCGKRDAPLCVECFTREPWKVVP